LWCPYPRNEEKKGGGVTPEGGKYGCGGKEDKGKNYPFFSKKGLSSFLRSKGTEGALLKCVAWKRRTAEIL